jgi:hypothetical protein
VDTKKAVTTAVITLNMGSISTPSLEAGSAPSAEAPALTELWPVLICRGSRSPLPGVVHVRH